LTAKKLYRKTGYSACIALDMNTAEVISPATFAGGSGIRPGRWMHLAWPTGVKYFAGSGLAAFAGEALSVNSGGAWVGPV